MLDLNTERNKPIIEFEEWDQTPVEEEVPRKGPMKRKSLRRVRSVACP